MDIDPTIIAELIAHADEVERQRQIALAPIVAGIALARRRQQTVEAGRLLLKAKGIVPYREWIGWLAEIGVPYQYAVRAMRLAREDRAVAQRWALRGAAE